jgi:hypothetical protein
MFHCLRRFKIKGKKTLSSGKWEASQVYNYHDTEACGYKRSGILPRIEAMVWEWLWIMAWYWIEMVLS